MSTDAFDIRGRISADSSPFDRAMDNSATSADRAFQSMASAANAFIGSGVVRSFIKATDAANKFGQSLADIASISEYNIGKLRNSILELNNVYGKSSVIADTMYEVISSGIRGSEEELVNFVKTVRHTAVSIKADLMDTANVMTTLTNAYGLTAADAHKLSDMLFITVREGKAHGNELARTLGLVSNTAAEAGVSLSEMSAVISVLSRTQSASQSMIGFNQLLNAIIKPTQEAQREARYWGIELSATALKTKGLAAILQELHDKTGGNVRAINAMLGNIRAMRAGVSLTGGQFKNFIEILRMAEAEIGTGVAMKAFETQTKTAAQSVENLKTQVNKTAIAVGKDFESLSVSVADFAEGMLKAFTDANTSWGTLSKYSMYIGAMGFAFSKILKAVSGIRTVMQGVVTVTNNINQAVSGTGKHVTVASGSLSKAGSAANTIAVNLSKADSAAKTLNQSINAISVSSKMFADTVSVAFHNIKQLNTLSVRLNSNLKGCTISVNGYHGSLNAVVKLSASMVSRLSEATLSLKHSASYSKTLSVNMISVDNAVKSTAASMEKFVTLLHTATAEAKTLRDTLNTVKLPSKRTYAKKQSITDASNYSVINPNFLASTNTPSIINPNFYPRIIDPKFTAPAGSYLPTKWQPKVEVMPHATTTPYNAEGFTHKQSTVIDVTNGSVFNQASGMKGLPYNPYHQGFPYAKPDFMYRGPWDNSATSSGPYVYGDPANTAIDDELAAAKKKQAKLLERYNKRYGTHLKEFPSDAETRKFRANMQRFAGIDFSTLKGGVGKVVGGLGKFTNFIGNIMGTAGIWMMAASALNTLINYINNKAQEKYDRETKATQDAAAMLNTNKFAHQEADRLFDAGILNEAMWREYKSIIATAKTREELQKTIKMLNDKEKEDLNKRKKTVSGVNEEFQQRRKDYIKKLNEDATKEARRTAQANVGGGASISTTTSYGNLRTSFRGGSNLRDVTTENAANAFRSQLRERGFANVGVWREAKGDEQLLKASIDDDVNYAFRNALSKANPKQEIINMRNHIIKQLSGGGLFSNERSQMIRNVEIKAQYLMDILSNGKLSNAERAKRLREFDVANFGEVTTAHAEQIASRVGTFDDVSIMTDLKASTPSSSHVLGHTPEHDMISKAQQHKNTIQSTINALIKNRNAYEKQLQGLGWSKDEISSALKTHDSKLRVLRLQLDDIDAVIDKYVSKHVEAVVKDVDKSMVDDKGQDRGIDKFHDLIDEAVSTQDRLIKNETASKEQRLAAQKAKDMLLLKYRERLKKEYDKGYNELKQAVDAGIKTDNDLLKYRASFYKKAWQRRGHGKNGGVLDAETDNEYRLQYRAAQIEKFKYDEGQRIGRMTGIMSGIKDFASKQDDNHRLSNDSLYHSINLMSRLSGGNVIQTSKGIQLTTRDATMNLSNAQEAQSAVTKSLDAYLMSQKYAEAQKGKAVIDIYNLLKQNIGKGITVN